MITIQHEPPIVVSGRAITAVARIRVARHVRNGRLIFVGDKQPVAIICRGQGSEEIFGIDGHRIDSAALEGLIADEYACCKRLIDQFD